MKIAICTAIDFKPAQDDKISHQVLATKFQNVDLTVAQVAENINQGYPFSAHHKDRRKDDNFICAGFIAVDIDHGWTLEEVLASPLVKNHGAIVYTTVSHTSEAPRLRVIFELERVISDVSEMRLALRGLIQYFDGDKACSAACQMFYGSKDCKPIVIGKTLPNEELDILIKLDEGASANKSSGPLDKIDQSFMPKGAKDDRRHSNDAPKRSAITLTNNQTVRTQNHGEVQLAALKAMTIVFCPVHHDKNASAFVVKNQAGINGVHCRACQQTFWPEGHARPALLEYDFFAYERHIDMLEYDEDPMMTLDDDAPVEYWNNDLRHVQRRNQKYLTNIPLERGITYMRSQKGTGKTTVLNQVVMECRDRHMTVLVIGHRQLLLGELARSLGLHFYKDRIDYGSTNKNSTFQYLAICIDSMPSLLSTAREQYDVVIIDESEQVFGHLVSQTLGANRRECYFQIEFFLRNAKSVILCDADLGFLSVKTVERMMDRPRRSKLYVNSHKPEGATIDVYDSKNHLIADMKQIVLDGGRHYICCNSKTTARLLKEILVAGGKSENKIMLITSLNSKEPKIAEFLKEIKTAMLKFDVLIASPSLGTGIDITFDNSAQLIDTTFGFFDANITTHFDLDQQLARVRHPKAVKAWVSPQISYVETNPNVIKEFCVTSRQVTDSLIGYDDAGRARYDRDDKILTLYAEVMSVANASKNNLKKHFIDLKVHNGWKVNSIEKNDAEIKNISKDIHDAKNLISGAEIVAILNARKLNDVEFGILCTTGNMHASEYLSYQRHLIEKFYMKDVSQDLIKLDNKGKFREQLRMMVLFMSNPFDLLERDAKRNERFSVDRGNNFLIAELLKNTISKTKIIDMRGNFNLNVEITTADLNDFALACMHKTHEIKTLLGINVRGDVLNKPVTQLNSILKLIGMKMQKVRQSDDQNNKRIFYYQVDRKLHDLVMEYLPLANRDVDFEIMVKEMTRKERGLIFGTKIKKK